MASKINMKTQHFLSGQKMVSKSNMRTKKLITGQRLASKRNMRTQNFIAWHQHFIIGEWLPSTFYNWTKVDINCLFLGKDWHQKFLVHKD